MRTRTCNLLFVGFCLCIVAPMAYWLSDRDPPFVRKWGEILPPNPTRGSVVSVLWTSEFRRDCPGIIQRHLEDFKGDIWLLPASVARYARTARNRQPLSEFVVPLHAACGPAKYKVDARYVCNWTQHWWPIHVDKPDIEFNIAC